MAAAIPIRINIDYNIEGLFASVRDRREVLRAAYSDAGLKWHQEYLPRHFKPSAAARYGYKPRSAGYLKRKERKAIEGGRSPLVFSGLLRRSVTALAVIRGFPSRFRVEMEVPSYIPARQSAFTTVNGRVVRRRAQQPPLVAEMTRLLPSEANSLATYLAQRITFHNNRVRRRRRVSIR